MKLLKHYVIKGKILLKTGLHIGAGSETIQIGGMDNPIIKSPLKEYPYPYIPGSSLKGKMRSLLEWQAGKFGTKRGNENGPCDCGQCAICRMFGTAGSEESTQGPTRIIIRDAFPTSESIARLQGMQQEKGLLYAEEKYENTIDRVRGTSKNLRSAERVPAGIDFDFEIVLRVFDDDNEQEMLNKKLLKNPDEQET
jgi:CRISPR-associated protein Csm3